MSTAPKTATAASEAMMGLAMAMQPAMICMMLRANSHPQRCPNTVVAASDSIIRLTSPVPPASVHPGPTVSSSHPPSADPHCTGERRHRVLPWNPNVFRAVPAPIPGSPNVTRRGRRRDCLNHGSRRGEGNRKSDSGRPDRRTREEQSRSAKGRNNPVMFHVRFPDAAPA